MSTPKRVSLVLPYVSPTQFYLGLRKIDQSPSSGFALSCVGGHANEGEDPLTAARRELTEETRLQPNPSTWKEIVQFSNPVDNTVIWLYSVQVTGEPDASKDPDREFKKFKLVDFTGGVPVDLIPFLYGPKNPQNNILVRVFGLQTTKSEIEPSDLGTKTNKDHSEKDGSQDEDEEVPQPATILEALETQGFSMLYYAHPMPEILVLHNGVKVGRALGTPKTNGDIDTNVSIAPEYQGNGLGLEAHKALLRTWLSDKDYSIKKRVLASHKLKSL